MSELIIGAEDPFLDDRTVLQLGDAVAAILIAPEGKYVLQRRDGKRGIFFPDHWGCFGGAIDAEDASAENALIRELREELGLDLAAASFTYFTTGTFDVSFCGGGATCRRFYEVSLAAAQFSDLRLQEGRAFGAFTAREAFSRLRLAPYDALVLWLHANRNRLVPHSTLERETSNRICTSLHADRCVADYAPHSA